MRRLDVTHTVPAFLVVLKIACLISTDFTFYTDVDFMTEVYMQFASSWVCVFLGNLLTLPSHVFLERAVPWCSFAQCPQQAADRAEATAEGAAVSLRPSRLWFLEGGGPAVRPQWCRLRCKEQQQLAAEWKAPAPADGFLRCPQWCKLTIPSGLAFICKDLLPRVRLKSFNKLAATQFHTTCLFSFII